jgi:hypothetical protein
VIVTLWPPYYREGNAVPIVQELDGHQVWSGWVRKILHSLGFDPQTDQPMKQ